MRTGKQFKQFKGSISGRVVSPIQRIFPQRFTHLIASKRRPMIFPLLLTSLDSPVLHISPHSISISIHTMHGWTVSIMQSAISKVCLLLQASLHLLTSLSGHQPNSLAKALIRKLFPVPGGSANNSAWGYRWLLMNGFAAEEVEGTQWRFLSLNRPHPQTHKFVFLGHR